MCEYKEANDYIVPRILIGAILFVCGFCLSPQYFILAYIVSGYDILWRAVKNIIRGHIFDENFLMSIATLGAICIQEFPEAVTVMILYQIGECLQDNAIDKSREKIKKLMDIRPTYANIGETKVNPNDVQIGDIITVNTGEKIPLDGVVIEGQASIDTSALTGESVPQKAGIGKEVFSGCINLDGILKIRVTKKYTDSTVSKILELVENAAERKAKAENFITKFARIYTPVVVIIACIIAAIPPFYIERALTFLVISCPCALVISIPLTFYAGIGACSKQGILIKGSCYLEALANISEILFDKTGTLTNGRFEVTHYSGEEVLKYAAYAEYASSHPIATAIKQKYKKEIPPQFNIQELAGQGIIAIIDGKEIKVGNAKLVSPPEEISGNTIVYVSIDNNYAGYISISDSIRKESLHTIKELKKNGIQISMLTGDSKNSAKTVSAQLELDNFYFNLLPQDKIQIIEKSILNNSKSIVYIGDGINDAPVLMRADIGIAMGGIGSAAAIEAADVVIMDDKISKIIKAIQCAKRTIKIAKQNIIFTLSLKVLFLILGFFGLITMWGAVFADVGTSLIAISNALRNTKTIE